MSEITAGECSHDCNRHSRALKRRTFTGAALAGGIGLQNVPWDSITAFANVIDPSLRGATIVAGGVFVVDVAIAALGRIKKWAKGRVFVVDLSAPERPPGKE